MVTGNYMIDGDNGSHSSSPYFEKSNTCPYGSRGSDFNEQMAQMEEIQELFGVQPERLEGEEYDWLVYVNSIDFTDIYMENYEGKAEPKLVEVEKGVVALKIAVYLISII